MGRRRPIGLGTVDAYEHLGMAAAAAALVSRGQRLLDGTTWVGLIGATRYRNRQIHQPRQRSARHSRSTALLAATSSRRPSKAAIAAFVPNFITARRRKRRSVVGPWLA